MDTELLARNHTVVVNLVKECRFLIILVASARRKTEVALTKSVEPRLGILDSEDNEILSASHRLGTQASVDDVVEALNLDITKMHHVEVFQMFLVRSTFLTAPLLGELAIRDPFGAMHAPALFTLVVHEKHVSHAGSGNQARSLRCLVQAHVDDVVPVPDEVEESVNIILVSALSSQKRVFGIAIGESLFLLTALLKD